MKKNDRIFFCFFSPSVNRVNHYNVVDVTDKSDCKWISNVKSCKTTSLSVNLVVHAN